MATVVFTLVKEVKFVKQQFRSVCIFLIYIRLVDRLWWLVIRKNFSRVTLPHL